MGFSLRQRGNLIRHQDPNQYGQYLSATDSGQAISRFADSSSSYADTLRQADLTNGRIFKLQYGTSGAPSTALDATMRGTIIERTFDKGGDIVNVKALAANSIDLVGVNSSTSDDTAAAEAAIARVKTLSIAQKTIGGEGRLIRLHFPAGAYNLIRPLDLDGLVGIRVTGDGFEATRFGIALTGASTALYWSTKSIISMVGSLFCRLEGFSVSPTNSTTAAIPECGLLLATNNTYTSWLSDSISANQANQIEVYSVRVRGAYTKAAIACLGLVSSILVNIEARRDKSLNTTYPNGKTINECALALIRDNVINVSKSGSVDFYTGNSAQCSDLTLVRPEVHDFCQG